MGRLTNSVRDQVVERGRRAPVPGWMGWYTILVGAVLGCFILVRLFTASDPEPLADQGSSQVVIPAPTQATTTVPPAPETGIDTSDLPAVRDSTGAEVSVPTEALNVAVSAAIGLYRGDLEGIPLLGSPPAVAEISPNPKVTEVLLISDPAALELSFTITMDLGDNRPPVTQPVTVTSTADRGWVWVPYAA